MLSYAVPYLLRVRHLAAAGRPVARWRQASFVAGLLVLVGAGIPPLSTLAGDDFSAHMAEHVLIADVAALLLVFGLTGPVLAPVLRLPGLRWVRAVAHPAVALPLWAVDLYAWHVPAFYDATLHHPWLHAIEHACFLFFGANLWMGLLGPLPKPAWFGNLARLGYIVAARLIGAVLGNVFLWAGSPVYASYRSMSDQIGGGAVMMVWESFLTLALFGWLFMRAARETEERQELLELAERLGADVDDRRVARAVSAGRGAELRLRLEAGWHAARPADGALQGGGQREQPGL